MSEVPVETMLDLELFRFDDEIQIREVLDPRWLDVFCELYRAEGPQALPPVVVFHDGDDVYWVADGHHRITAAREALSMDGPRALPAKVHDGDKRAAILYAAGANGKHGLPLTGFEKFRAVRRLLDDSEWQQWSDREIARHTGTSHVFVAKVRSEVDLNAAASGSDFQIPNTTRKVRRGGTTFRMRTDKIGRRRGSQPRSMPLASLRAAKDDDIDDAHDVTISTGIGALRMHGWRQPTQRAASSWRGLCTARSQTWG